MGGRPITALSIVGFPSNLPASVLTDILRGGSEKVEEAGAVVVGGHSIKDKELKYGISVTGLVDPYKVLTNSGAKPGDILYLTKRLGTGLITTAIKRNAVSPDLIDEVIEQMAELGVEYVEQPMADGSGVTIRIDSSALPLLPRALEFAEQNMIPGGANANREYLSGKYIIENTIDKNLEHILFDPQTSGGLFISIPESSAEAFETEMREKQVFGVRVGKVESKSDFALIVS